MAIITVTYPDRGFARIGIPTLAKKITQNYVPKLNQVYEVETSGSDIWIRNKERRSGNYRDYIEELALVDANTNRDAKWISNLDPYYDKIFREISNKKLPIEIMTSIDKKKEFQQVYYSSLVLLFVEPRLRESFLRDFYFPWFFKLFPDGKIIALRLNSNYETRIALLRLGNVLSIYESPEIEKMIGPKFEGIRTMAEIHETGTVNVKSYLTAFSNLFFPKVGSFVVGGFGYIFVLLTNNQSLLKKGPYPPNEIELHRMLYLMSGDRPDLSNLTSEEEGWRGRYIPTKSFTASELVVFYREFISQINRNVRLRLDVTNYRDGDDIDFIKAFEEYFTLDRITLELIRCQTATDGYSARTISFSILDKFMELFEMVSIPKNRNFHCFVTKSFRDNILSQIYKSYPPPFANFFEDESVQIYDSLYNTILGKDGLWMNHLRSANGVKIREWDKTNKKFIDSRSPIPDDDFVGEIVRAVRNTHHGYISEEDKRRRFPVFVSMHSGKLPDNFTAIPQLIWLAAMKNPENTILTNWISDATLQSAPI